MYHIVIIISILLLLVTPSNSKADSFDSTDYTYKKLHLSFDYGVSYSTTEDDIKCNLYSSSFFGTVNILGTETKYPTSDIEHWCMRGEVLYRWHQKWQTGVGVYVIPTIALTGYGGSDFRSVGPFEESEGTLYYAVVDYIIDPIGELFRSRWEFSFGAGLSYSSLKLQGDMGTIYQDIGTLYSESWELKKNKFGGVLRGTLNYYVRHATSMGLRFGVNIIPTVHVPGQSFSTRELKPHTVNFTTFDLVFSLGFHF